MKGTEARKWILKLNPKGQATIPVEVRRVLGVDGEKREIEVVLKEDGFHLRLHKTPLPVKKYIGYCAEELNGVDNAVAFVRELRGRDTADDGE